MAHKLTFLNNSHKNKILDFVNSQKSLNTIELEYINKTINNKFNSLISLGLFDNFGNIVSLSCLSFHSKKINGKKVQVANLLFNLVDDRLNRTLVDNKMIDANVEIAFSKGVKYLISDVSKFKRSSYLLDYLFYKINKNTLIREIY